MEPKNQKKSQNIKFSNERDTYFYPYRDVLVQ